MERGEKIKRERGFSRRSKIFRELEKNMAVNSGGNKSNCKKRGLRVGWCMWKNSKGSNKRNDGW